MRGWWMLLMLVGVAGCKGDKDEDQDGDADTDADADADADADSDPGVQLDLELTTRDGVTLVADFYNAGSGKPAILFLHANPEGQWDRKDWPQSFIGKLQSHTWSVMALDRRGAGDSGGVAREAWEGPKGKWDVEAASLYLEDAGAASLIILGASNGTTSMIDYAIAAPDQGWMEPIAYGFLTGGTYSETNNPISDLPQAPAVFTYAFNENAWSDQQAAGAPNSWEFFEYQTLDGHGTKIFGASPQSEDDLEGFLEGVLPG